MKLFVKKFSTTIAITLMTGGYFAAEDNSEDVDEANNTIMVTATRRSENVQEVPISLTVVDGDYMERSGIKTIEDLAIHVPNFSINTSNQTTNARLTIRGVGSVGNNAIEGSVGVFIDGVYYPRPGSVLGNLLDINSIEVLRGPQGTLFGRNTPMGALNITTTDPDFDNWSKLHLSYGNFGDTNLGGTVSGELAESVAGLASVNYSQRDGYGFNEFSNKEFADKDDISFRGKILVEVSDSIEAKITADYAEVNHTGQVVEILPETNNPVFMGTTQALFGIPATTGDAFDRIVNQDNNDDANDQQWGISAQLKIDFEEYEFKSITAFRDWENTYLAEGTLRLPADLLPRNSYFKTDTLSQEFQILSPKDDFFDYVAGLFYYQENYDIDQNFDAGSQYCIPTVFGVVRGQLLAAGMDPAQATTTAMAQATACSSFAQNSFAASEFEQELKSLAAFAQGTFHISEQLSATIGIRWTRDDKTGSFEQVLTNPFASLVRAPESSPNLSFDDSKVTWLANVRYQFSDDIMGFVTTSTGFKSGGFNSQGASTDIGDRRVFNSETTENFELGLKTSYFEKAMVANLTFFRTDISDFQDRSFDGLSFLTSNAGKLRQQGIELDFNATATDNFTISGGLGYLDSEFLSYPNASSLPGGTVSQDLTGQSNHRAPKLQANLTADWSIEMEDSSYSWFLRPSISYIDEQNLGGDTNQNPQTIQSAYTLASIRTGIEDFSAGWRLEIYADNLTDKGYCGGMFDQPFGAQLGAVNQATNTTVIRCVVGTPRTYGIRYSHTF